MKSGIQTLGRHASSANHNAAASYAASQPNIQRCIAPIVTQENGRLKATIIHCLRLVVDGSSLKSSDTASRKGKCYSKMFPDSSYSDIDCGRTKAGYVIALLLRPLLLRK